MEEQVVNLVEETTEVLPTNNNVKIAMVLVGVAVCGTIGYFAKKALSKKVEKAVFMSVDDVMKKEETKDDLDIPFQKTGTKKA